eukprot:EC722161.1.p2 GENE.EC722161.1~~EC722161.1.p2  ORF type:complete len:151 (+),score=12.26 EC722161.1:32-484(+)
MAVRDRVAGLLLGIASGDRNRGPMRMAWRLGRSLVEQRKYDGDDIWRRYWEWMTVPFGKDSAFDTGNTIEMVVSICRRDGVSPKEAAMRVFKATNGAGVNPAHRSTPLACAAFLSDKEVAAAAADECVYTHGTFLTLLFVCCLYISLSLC